MSTRVWLVSFELINNPLDDNGIEGIFATEELAKEYINCCNKKYPKYKFEILGDYYIIERINND